MVPRSKRGFTLLELTIYSALLSVLLLAIYGVFVASMRYFRVSQASSDLQTSAQKAVLTLVGELSESTLEQMKIEPSPPGIIFASPRNANDQFMTDGNGNIIWQTWVCYYYDSSKKAIIRKEQPIVRSSPYTPEMIPNNPYSTVSFSGLAGGRTIANNCTAFTITGTSAITIQATFETTVNSNATNTSDSRVTITDTFNVRN